MTGETKTKHYVKFFYQEAFVGEDTSVEVEYRMGIGSILRLDECKSAYAFQTYERDYLVKNGKDYKGDIKKHKYYYIDGKVYSLEQAKKQLPNNETLIANMTCNKWKYVIQTRYGWMFPFEKEDGNVLMSDYVNEK